MKRVHLVGAAILVPFFQMLAESSVLELRHEIIDLVAQEPLDLVHRVETLSGTVQSLAITETGTEVRIDLSGDVLFDFDSFEIKPDAETMLAEVAEVLSQHPGQTVLVGGHTDSIGSAEYNLRLSRQRAEAVRNWLVSAGGVETGRLQTRGFGVANPVAPNTHPDGSDNPEGRQQNRRVEITVRKQ